jgi:hypothetical protein
LLAVEGRAGPLAASGRIQSLVGVSALLPALIRTILEMPGMPLLGRGPSGSIANLARQRDYFWAFFPLDRNG